MNEFLMSLDWAEFLGVIWTVILLPFLKKLSEELNAWAQSKKIDKYTAILEKNVMVAVKDVYQTIVVSLKGTPEWTEEKMLEVKEIAKKKAINALSNLAYETLLQANEDLESRINSMIEASLYDLKYGKVSVEE